MKCNICGKQRGAFHSGKCTMTVELGARYERTLEYSTGRIFFKVVAVVVSERSLAVGEVEFFQVKEFSFLRERFCVPVDYTWRMVAKCRKLGPEEKVI